MNLKNSKIALFVFSLGAVALIGCNNKPVTSKVTITFDGNGGTVEPANGSSEKVTVDKGTLFKDVKAPKAEKTDYTFDAWTSTKDDITTKIKDDYVFNADITLFAHYTEVSSYTYKFVDGDKTIKEDTIKKGETIIAPEDLDDKHDKDPDGGDDYYHFAFDGWYDGETKFVIGTTISKDVTYTSKFTKGNEITHLDGEVPTCSEPGYKEAYMCEDCYPVETYYDVPDSIDDEHLIGDIDEYNYWISAEGEGYLEPTGEHNYQPELRGTYKQNYTALETFVSTGLEVYLHCSYETEHTNDVKIDDFDVEYEANDDKLHVNNGGASVTFTYDGVDYEEELPLTIAPISVDEPAAGTNSFTYTGSVITYTVATSDRYTISNNTATDVGNYNATIALTDKGGDYVWKTSTTTDDLTYPFSITKATNAITGLAESYTTTCHTAPTITDVTSTFGTVQYDYWKQVGTGEKEKVEVSGIEKAADTTYYVRAFVPGTGNYDLVEQYVELTVNHDCKTETVPTDHIGYTELNCACGHKEDSTNLMESENVNFKASTFGIKVKKVVSGGEEDYGSVELDDDGTKATFGVNTTDKFKIYLPLTNFSAFETNVTFNMKVKQGWFYMGFSDSIKCYVKDNDLIYVKFKKDDNSFKLAITRNGSAVFNESITIEDTDILNGTKQLGLYVDCLQELDERIVTFLSADLDECSHPLISPADHIGYRECVLCGLKSEELMTSNDVDFKTNTYGVSLKKGAEDFGTIGHSGTGTTVNFGKSDDDLNLYLPLTNYSAYETNVIFKFEATSAWFYIGFSSNNLFYTKNIDNTPNDIIYVIYKKANNSVSLVVDRNGAKEFEDSITITDDGILNGSKSLPLIIRNSVDTRVITFLNAQLDECNHEFTRAPTDHIGYRECALCGAESKELMTSSDVDLTKNLYGIEVIGGAEKGTVSTHATLGANFHFLENSKFSLPAVNLRAYEKVAFSNGDGSGTQGYITYVLGEGQSCAFQSDHTLIDFTFERINDSSYKLKLVVHDTEEKSCEATITDTDILTGKKGFEVEYRLQGVDRTFSLGTAELTPLNPVI